MNDKEVIEIITSWVALTKKIDRWCIRFNDMQQRAEALFQENIRLRKRIKELENDKRTYTSIKRQK